MAHSQGSMIMAIFILEMEKCVRQMSSVLAWADITKYSRLDGLNHGRFSVTAAGKANIKVPADLFLVRTPFLVFTAWPSLRSFL